MKKCYGNEHCKCNALEMYIREGLQGDIQRIFGSIIWVIKYKIAFVSITFLTTTQLTLVVNILHHLLSIIKEFGSNVCE